MRLAVVTPLCALLIGSSVNAATISDYISINDRTAGTLVAQIGGCNGGSNCFITEGVEGALETSVAYTSGASVGYGLNPQSQPVGTTVFLTDGPGGLISDTIQFSVTNDSHAVSAVFFTVTMFSDASVGGTLPGGVANFDEGLCQATPCDITRLLFPKQTPGIEPLQVFVWSDLDIIPPPPPPPNPLPEPSTVSLALAGGVLALIHAGAMRLSRKRASDRVSCH